MKSLISIRDIRKSFNGGELYGNLNLEIEAGKITSIFGPNGSGKSTLLNILAGIVRHDGGIFTIDGFDHREFSYIFQNYRDSLLPWRTNFENLALPLEFQGKSREFIAQRIDELQKLFEFDCDWERYPYELSGGQQQILAFLRALITRPKLLFVDEPFSALDYGNNLKLRKHLQAYFLAYRPTIVLITHNIEEAVHLSDRIVVFGSKPAKVIASVDNPLAFPRNIDTLKSEAFHRTKDAVLNAFLKTETI
ncbi:MAG: nitrate transporter ATP-binding protein [Candidatus Taylorbacteria bacterium]|nr:nitrate transporter ATP-binding protein [Candidatus Taylorbacteria bacterium]